MRMLSCAETRRECGVSLSKFWRQSREKSMQPPPTMTVKTLERTRSKGYAPRIVAAGTYPTTSYDEEVIVINETGAQPAGISQRISPLTMPRLAGKARGAPAVALKSKQSILSPPSAAPPPAKVSPPLKSPVPVIDARLRISCSKVPPLISALH